jgi:hypothetical protein
MSKTLSVAIVATLVGSAVATAHFVYVVPTKDAGVQVVFSDDLTPDENVPVDKITGLKLSARVGGKDTPVETKADKHSLTATLPKGTTLAHGSVTYGLFTKGEKPALLVYHPKLVLNGLTDKDATAGDKAAVELVPVPRRRQAGGGSGRERAAAGRQEGESEDGQGRLHPGVRGEGAVRGVRQERGGEGGRTRRQEVRADHPLRDARDRPQVMDSARSECGSESRSRRERGTLPPCTFT